MGCVLIFLMMRRPPRSTLFPCSTLFRSLFELVELDRTAAIRARAGESEARRELAARMRDRPPALARELRSEEHTSELQSQSNLVCRLLLVKKPSQCVTFII